MTHSGKKNRESAKAPGAGTVCRILAAAALLTLLTVLSIPSRAAAEGPVLGLRDAVARGIQQNLDLGISRLDIPVREQDVVSGEAAFDPSVEASLSAGDRKLLTGVIFYENDYQLERDITAGVGILKQFETGLHSRLSFETLRAENNFLADTLDPNYRNIIVLQLTQPLLRDFGTDVNTANIRVSKNQVRQAAAQYMGRAQTLGGAIEQTYLDLAGASAVLAFAIQSRALAAELLAGNRRRLEQGMISVTEVDEAKTAVVDRDEAVIQARQRVETLSNQLKDLMDVDPADPLYAAEIRTTAIPTGTQPHPGKQAAVEIAFGKRPDLKGLQLARESQEILVQYYRNQKKPQMDLVASAGINGLSGGNSPVTIFGGTETSPLAGNYGDAYSSMFQDGGYQVSAELRFHYPVGNRAARAQYRKSRLEQRKVELLIDRTKHRIETEINNAFVAVDRSLERVVAGERFVRLAEKTLDQEAARLNSGLSDTFRVLDYQEKLVSARIRHITALIDYQKGLARLHQAMGTNLERYDILASVDEAVMDLLEN